MVWNTLCCSTCSQLIYELDPTVFDRVRAFNPREDELTDQLIYGRSPRSLGHGAERKQQEYINRCKLDANLIRDNYLPSKPPSRNHCPKFPTAIDFRCCHSRLVSSSTGSAAIPDSTLLAHRVCSPTVPFVVTFTLTRVANKPTMPSLPYARSRSPLDRWRPFP